MNAFDTSVQTWLVHIGASSVIFTHAVHTIADFYLTKGLLPLAVLWAICTSGMTLMQERLAYRCIPVRT